MMNNLFSMFDPASNILKLNWLAMIFPLFLTTKLYFLNSNRIKFLTLFINKMIFKDMIQVLMKNHSKMNIIFMLMFMSMYMMNLMSLNPFIFTPTSHLSLTLFLSLPLWFSFMFKGWIKNLKSMLTHMVPMGTPTVLIPFMVMIETISMIIRPMTLSVRLTANMIAGHILIALLSNLLNMNMLIMLFSSLIVNMLMVLETAVCVIQSYVFITLMSLYLSDIK